MPVVQHGREHRAVADPARDLDRLAAQRVAPRGVGREVERARERAQNQRAQRRIFGTETRERRLEQLDQRLVDRAGLGARRDDVHRGASERNCVAALAGEARRLVERRVRAVLVARPALRVAELEQQLETPLRVARRRALRLQRALVVSRGLLEAEARDRAVAGARRVLDSLLGPAERRRLPEVVRELAEHRRRVLGVERLEHLAGAQVQLGALDDVELVEQRRLQERVREPVLARALRLDDQACAQRGLEVLEHRRARRSRQRREGLERRLEPEDRGLPQHSTRGRRQRIEATADRLAHRVGNAKAALRRARVLLAARAQQLGDLDDEERVAAGRAVHGGDQGPRRRRPVAANEQARHLVGGEAAERDAVRDARHGGEQLRRSGRRRELGLAVRPEEQHACVAQLTRDVVEQQQRLAVRPVQVVKHYDERLDVARAAHQRRDRVEQAEARGLAVVAVVDRRLLVAGESRRETRELERCRSGELAHALDRAMPDHPAQHLDPRPVRGRPLGLVAASPRDAVLQHLGDQALDDAGLADARLAGDEHAARPSRLGVGERAGEKPQLVLAPDERAARLLAQGAHACAQARADRQPPPRRR